MNSWSTNKNTAHSIYFHQTLTVSAVPGVVLVQDHEEGRHDEEQDVGGGVDELGDVRGEGVVVLAPVDGTRAPLQMPPHL